MSVPAFVAAVESRSLEALRAALSPKFAGKANGRPMDGEAQIRLIESFWNGFPDAGFKLEATGGHGRHVITWSLEGTHGGVYLGVPPTGTPIRLSGFIVSVSDATGIVSLDWKWDTKVFARAVLGPDQVGDLEVKDRHRPDPSVRWSHGSHGHGRGKGRQQGAGGQQQSGQRHGQRQKGRKPKGKPADAAPKIGSETPETAAPSAQENPEVPTSAPSAQENPQAPASESIDSKPNIEAVKQTSPEPTTAPKSDGT